MEMDSKKELFSKASIYLIDCFVFSRDSERKKKIEKVAELIKFIQSGVLGNAYNTKIYLSSLRHASNLFNFFQFYNIHQNYERYIPDSSSVTHEYQKYGYYIDYRKTNFKNDSSINNKIINKGYHECTKQDVMNFDLICCDKKNYFRKGEIILTRYVKEGWVNYGEIGNFLDSFFDIGYNIKGFKKEDLISFVHKHYERRKRVINEKIAKEKVAFKKILTEKLNSEFGSVIGEYGQKRMELMTKFVSENVDMLMYGLVKSKVNVLDAQNMIIIFEQNFVKFLYKNRRYVHLKKMYERFCNLLDSDYKEQKFLNFKESNDVKLKKTIGSCKKITYIEEAMKKASRLLRLAKFYKQKSEDFFLKERSEQSFKETLWKSQNNQNFKENEVYIIT